MEDAERLLAREYLLIEMRNHMQDIYAYWHQYYSEFATVVGDRVIFSIPNEDSMIFHFGHNDRVISMMRGASVAGFNGSGDFTFATIELIQGGSVETHFSTPNDIFKKADAIRTYRGSISPDEDVYVPYELGVDGNYHIGIGHMALLERFSSFVGKNPENWFWVALFDPTQMLRDIFLTEDIWADVYLSEIDGDFTGSDDL